MAIRGRAIVGGCLVLALGPVVARSDMFPEEELYGFEISTSAEIVGLSQFPEHVFYLFPLRCTRALVGLDEGGVGLGNEDLKVEEGLDDQPNYAVLQDGALDSWIGEHNPCPASGLYAMGREAAAGVDLAAMSLEAQQTFFADNRRVFRSEFKFIDRPQYANTGSPLRAVHEVIKVLRIDEYGIKAVIEEVSYRFEDGTEQTVKLAHTKRPPELPFRAMKPAKVAKYESAYAKWLARQPSAPPVAPELPWLGDVAETSGEGGGESGATDGAAVTGGEAAVAVPVVPVVPAVVEAPAVVPVVAPETKQVATPVVAETAAPVVAAAAEDVVEVEVAEERPFLRRAWPLAVAFVAGVGAAIALRRRPRG